VVGLITNKAGNFIKKPMKECNGIEIASELLYHLGCPESNIERIAKAMNTIPVFMPYITSFFMPRTIASRPLVVPINAKNFAFIGQFAETERDCVFTVEYSARTAMQATYTLFNVDRAVPEVYGSFFDIRYELEAMYLMADKKDIFKEPSHHLLKKIAKSSLFRLDKKRKYSFVIEMLKKYHLFPKK
jgi:oleate hydratase